MSLDGYFIEDLQEGMTAVFGKTITDADILMFAGVSGDTNPVHLNEEFAAGTAFQGRIAHGMLTASLISTVLCALDRLWGLDLGEERLAALGLRLGADVPVFVRGRSAWAEGVGEKLVPVTLPQAWYVLVDPGVHVPTAELFGSPDLTRDSPPAKMADFAAGTVLDNAFEPVLRRREPAVEAAFAALAQVGEPRLTGSGSGCFVEFGDRASAQAALQSLPPGLGAWIAGGAARSALHAALDAFRLQGRRQVVQGTGF